MGNGFGRGILTENGVKNIRAGHPPLRQNLRMKTPEDADVADQPGIIGGIALSFGEQPFDQPEILQLRQHLFHRAEHSVMGVNKGAVPIEQQRSRHRERTFRSHHSHSFL